MNFEFFIMNCYDSYVRGWFTFICIRYKGFYSNIFTRYDLQLSTWRHTNTSNGFRWFNYCKSIGYVKQM